MERIKLAWEWLSGKKTAFGMFLLFIYGGLTYLSTSFGFGWELGWLETTGFWVGSLGLGHKAVKKVKE